MKSNLKFKGGQMLIIGILFLTILLIFSTTIFTKVRYFINFGTNATLREQARHVAEAGVDFAAREITNTPTYAGTGATPVNLGETGNFEVIVNSPSQNLKTATVTGYAPKTPGQKAKTKIQINLEPSGNDSTDVLAGSIRDNAVVENNGYIYSLGGQSSGCNILYNVQFAKIISDGSSPGNGFLKEPIASTTNQPLSGPRIAPGGIAANGFIYEIAGNNCATPTSTIFYAQPNAANGDISSAWSQDTTDLPPAGSVSLAFYYSGYIYIIQGRNISYAPQNAGGDLGTWTTQSLATPDDWPSYVFVNDGSSGYIYHISGNHTRSVWYAEVKADHSVSIFTEIPDVLPTQTTRSAVATANGFIYVMGGETRIINRFGNFSEPPAKSVYYTKIQADHKVGPFTTSPKNLPGVRWAEIILSSISKNNKLFLFGGIGGGNYTDTAGNVWVADIDSASGALTSDWTDNGGLITYSGWGLDKATYIYK